MYRKKRIRYKLIAATLTCGCLFANATCFSRSFADDIAADTARDLANLLIDALVINPLEDAVTETE